MRRLRLAATIAAAALLTLVAYAPLVAHPNSTVLYQPGDASSAARDYWAMHHLHKTPFTMARDTLIEAPEGIAASTALQIANAAEPLFMLAVEGAGYLTAVNAYQLVGVFLTLVTMYLLLTWLGLHPIAAALAAIGYASSQWVIEQLLYGHIAFAHVWIFPLMLAALLRARRGPPWRGAVAGLATGLAFELSSYLGLFAAAMAVVFVVTVALERRAGDRTRGALTTLAFGIAGWILGVVPTIAAPYLGPSSTLGLPGGTRADLEGATLGDYLTPSVHHALYGRMSTNGGENVVFFGYALTLLAIACAAAVAVRRLPTTTPVLFSLLLAPIGIILSLPAYAHPFGERVPLPDAAWLVGGFVHWWRVYARFGILVGFAIAVLAAYALDALVRSRRRWVPVAVAALAAAIVFEAAPGFPVASARIRPDSATMWLRAHADGGIVAVYPLVPWTTPNTDGNPTWTSFNWDTFFLQTVHQHPLYSLPRIEMNPRRSDEIRVLTSDLSNPQTAGILRAEHIRWVLVRDDIYRAIGQTPPAHPPGLREVASLADARIYTPVAAPESPDVAIHARQVELARAYALASAQVSVGSGFYGPEQFNGSTIHWMQQDGHVVLTQLVARPFVEYRLTISAFANARPRRITLAIGGRDIGSFVVGTSTTTYETTVKLPTRVTTLVLHSDPPPNVMSVADPRITSICLVSLAADPVAVEVVPG